MELVADLFSGLLAFVFGSAAIGKLVRQRQQVQTAEKLRIQRRGSFRHGAAARSATCRPRAIDVVVPRRLLLGRPEPKAADAPRVQA
jgi:hypothetical protein